MCRWTVLFWLLASTQVDRALAVEKAPPSSPTSPLGPAASSPATASPIASAAVETCVQCHADLSTPQLRAPVDLTIIDVHAGAGVTCTACHGGDATARSAAVAHAKGFMAHPAGAQEEVALCGRCHAEPASNFQRSPHFLTSAVKRKASCVTCHGAHGVAEASLDIIAEPLCSSCHPIAQARRIWKALTDTEKDLVELEPALATEPDGAAQKTKLQEARSKLRGLSHSLDLFAITREAAQLHALAHDTGERIELRRRSLFVGKVIRIAGGVLGGVLLLAAAGWVSRVVWRRRHHILVKPSRRLLTFAAVGGLIGLFGTAAGWRGYSYVQHDPTFCTSCHIMDSAYQAWAKSGHQKTECHACHTPDLKSNLHQLWLYTTRRPEDVAKHAYVNRDACKACHESTADKSKWNQVTSTPGHRIHVGKQNIECVQCHAPSVHHFKPAEEVCATCHKQVTLTAAGSMSEMHCLQCHPFLAKDGTRTLKPDRAACLDCHGELHVKGEVFPEDAPMRWACGECHKPHKQIRIGTEECLGCHEGEVGAGIHAVKAHKECLECHRPHGWKVTGREVCESCHHDRQSHNPGSDCADCHGVE